MDHSEWLELENTQACIKEIRGRVEYMQQEWLNGSFASDESKHMLGWAQGLHDLLSTYFVPAKRVPPNAETSDILDGEFYEIAEG